MASYDSEAECGQLGDDHWPDTLQDDHMTTLLIMRLEHSLILTVTITFQCVQ